MHVSVVPLILLWSSTLVHTRQYTWYMHVTVVHCTRTHSTIQTRHKKRTTYAYAPTLWRAHHTQTHTCARAHGHQPCTRAHTHQPYHTCTDTATQITIHTSVISQTMQYSYTSLILKNKIQQYHWYRAHTLQRARRTNTHTHTNTQVHHTHRKRTVLARVIKAIL